MARKAKQESASPNGMSPAERKALERAKLKTGGGSWPKKDPTPGDFYCGDYVSREEIESTFKRKNGEPVKMQNCYHFVRDEVKTRVWGSAVMDSELEALELQPGQRVLILYQGVSANSKPGQNPAKLFSAVLVE